MKTETYNSRRRRFKNYLIAHASLSGSTIELSDIQRIFDNAFPSEEIEVKKND